MKPTLDDLRVALRDEAENTAYPDVDALVAGARRRVIVARRRRLASLSAATAAVLVVGGLVATTGGSTLRATPPAAPGLGHFTVNGGGAGFPEYQEGLKLLTVQEAPMLEQLQSSFSVSTTPGQRLVLIMGCTPAEIHELNRRTVAKFTGPDSTLQSSCTSPAPTGMAQDSIGIAKAATTTVRANVVVDHASSAGSGLSLKDAKMQVAIYGSVPWQDYPFPPRPTDLGVNPDSVWSSEPDAVAVLGPETIADANKTLTFVQPYEENLEMRLKVRGPGRFRVSVDGEDVSGQLGLGQANDMLSYWDFIMHDTGFQLFPLLSQEGATAPPAPKPGTPITVTITPQDFHGPDWQVVMRTPHPN